MWADLDFDSQVIGVKRAHVWERSKRPSQERRKPRFRCTRYSLGFCWHGGRGHLSETTVILFFRASDLGKKPLSASVLAQKYLRPAAVKAGVLKTDERVRFGFHNFRHSLASALMKLKCDPKTVQGILRHEDVRTTMQLYGNRAKNRSSRTP